MASPRLLFPLSLLLLMMLAPDSAAAAEIGWIERYALASDRSAVLEELVPGSEEYFFYHSLHYQVTGDLDRAETMLTDWQNAIEDENVPLRHSGMIQAIRDRQRLLTYGASPERTIEYLKNRLGVRHNHSAPQSAGERRWPERMDQDLLQVERVIDESVRSSQQLTQVGLSRLADRFLAGEAQGLPVDLEWLTNQIDGPWYGRLGELVIAELEARPRPDLRQFGDRGAHVHLTLDQLQEVAREIPEVALADRMVSEILLRLRPDEDADMSQQPEVRLAYLQRADAYLQTLPEAYNSLKAAILYQLLQANQARGNYDRELFIRYLRLPRLSPIIIDTRELRRRSPANLNEDFSDKALVPPIGDEQPVVRDYLERFLRDADSTEPFDGLLRPDYLKRVFAETKLLYGVGPSARWYPMLDPAQRQALNERVELTLAESNPRRHDADAPARLEVDLKHVDELVVRVYEINTHAYYRTHTAKIDTDIDLDGLVATDEKRIEYKLPAVRRHRETIDVPGIEGRGVWVVDLLGGGLRARALVRRGDLRYAEEWTVDGHQFTILDQQRKPIKDARMLIGSQEWMADDEGRIVIPPVDHPRQQQAILMDDALAVPVDFDHRNENYSLSAAMVLNRQQLQAGRMVDLVVRPRLMFFGQPIAPSMLQQTTITIQAVDRDGITTTKRFDDVELDQNGETVVRFRSVPRMAELSASVSGRITAIATGREIRVEDSRSWDVNGIDATSQTSDVHLTRDGQDWIVEVRGLNGEPLSGSVVRVDMSTWYRDQPVSTTLETDDAGRIVLGPLPGVSAVTLRGDGRTAQSREIELADAVWPARLHTTSDEPVRLPLANSDENIEDNFRLLAMRDGRPHRDVTAAGLAVDQGMLVAGPLEAGDYQLIDRRRGSYRTTPIAVTEGPMVGSIAAGVIRSLPLKWGPAIGVSDVDTGNGEAVVIKLSGDLARTRVHVFGSRYLPSYDSLQMTAPRPEPRGVELGESGYVSDLRLGDEYLYVMRRQYAKKYPGVMLPQPSLLVAPWVTDETQNAEQQATEGEAVPPSAAFQDGPFGASGEGMDGDRADRIAAQATQNLAFLPNSGVVLANLRPDENGEVQIPSDQLGDAALLRIVVVDPLSTIERTVVRELKPLEPRDLRLTEALPAEKPLAFERGVLVAGPERPLEMQSVGTAQIQVYTEVADLLQLYRTISGDGRLDEFVELGRWHTLDDAAKRAAYGRLASHEVHVFLKAKDPGFFDAVVRPYLENKKEKKLVDHWLLDRDLTPWMDLWQYANLNAFEKAVLARALPDSRDAVLRELRERIALMDVDPDVLRKLIDAGLAGKAMEQDAKLSLQLRRSQLSEPGEAQAASAFGMGGGMGGGGRYGGAGITRASADPFADNVPNEPASEKSAEQIVGDFAVGDVERRQNFFRERAMDRRRIDFFQQLDSTKQWAENHWDHVRVAQAGESLVSINPFWLDWAEADPEGDFVSEHLLRASDNRHAVLIALALLDLPLESEGVELPTEEDGTFTPPHPVAIITKRLKSLEPLDADASLLVGQRFEPVDATPPRPGDDAEIKIAPDEFLMGRAYRGQIVLTNPTPQPRIVDVLWQIPEGSLPIAGSQATDSRTLRIDPFAVERIEFQFYFPSAGTFTHYPVSVSHEGQSVARGSERTFEVVERFSEVDEASWEQIARNGSAERIQQFLQDANLHRLNLSLVAHRLQDRAVYDAVMDVLDAARVWEPELWGYSLLYRDRPRMKTYLEQRRDLVASVGPVLKSPLLSVEPISRKMYEHLEYAPLVRARIHPLRDQPEILNDRFLEHYRSLMRVIAFQESPTAEQQLALCYYMLLQNRIEEAIERFNNLDRSSIEMSVQYDYMDAYLALHRGDFERAGKVADQRLDHPVPRWRERFTQLHSQLRQRQNLRSGSRLVGSDEEEAEQGGVREDAADLAVMDREQRQAEGATASPDVRVRVEGDQLVIDHRNARKAEIRFYGVDLELLFSKTPFVREGLERMATVRPGRVESVTLGEADGTIEYRLDEALTRQTLLVEVIAGPSRDTTLYYGGRLTSYVSEGFGQVQTKDRATGEPLVGAYVKVYARDNDGNVRFYKDGYTDLRGRFDYATLSSGNLGAVERMAILVMDAERGATLHDVAPPK